MPLNKWKNSYLHAKMGLSPFLGWLGKVSQYMLRKIFDFHWRTSWAGLWRPELLQLMSELQHWAPLSSDWLISYSVGVSHTSTVDDSRGNWQDLAHISTTSQHRTHVKISKREAQRKPDTSFCHLLPGSHTGCSSLLQQWVWHLLRTEGIPLKFIPWDPHSEVDGDRVIRWACCKGCVLIEGNEWWLMDLSLYRVCTQQESKKGDSPLQDMNYPEPASWASVFELCGSHLLLLRLQRLHYFCYSKLSWWRQHYIWNANQGSVSDAWHFGVAWEWVTAGLCLACSKISNSQEESRSYTWPTQAHRLNEQHSRCRGVETYSKTKFLSSSQGKTSQTGLRMSSHTFLDSFCVQIT